MDTISEHLDLNAQNYVHGVFIDFSSAFNTISPTILIEKLKQTDLHPNLINWIYSYLCNRTQRVISQINTSDWITSSTGSPQGCVLSPNLFSIYVVEMGKSRPPTQGPSLSILMILWYSKNSTNTPHHRCRM